MSYKPRHSDLSLLVILQALADPIRSKSVGSWTGQPKSQWRECQWRVRIYLNHLSRYFRIPAAPARNPLQRVLVVLAPSDRDPRLLEQQAFAAAAAAGFSERDLIVVAETGTEGSLHRMFGTKVADFQVVLIGKDGRSTFQWSKPVSSEILGGTSLYRLHVGNFSARSPRATRRPVRGLGIEQLLQICAATDAALLRTRF